MGRYGVLCRKVGEGCPGSALLTQRGTGGSCGRRSDTLATALHVRTDDLLKDHPHRIPWRPKVGIASVISDAEMVTLSVMQALLGSYQ